MTTHEPDELAQRYIDLWNEPDAARRAERVAALWAHDGALYNDLREYRGHEGLCVAVQRSFAAFVGGGHRYRLGAGAMAHHDGLGVPWEMLAPGGDEVVSHGVNFLLLDGAGAITLDYQFVARG